MLERSRRMLSPETLRAAALAGAALAANGVAAVFTVVFARVLGAEDYGTLAALVATFLIMSVPGSALQAAVARETALGRLGSGPELWGRTWAWTKILAAACVGASAVAALLREPLAALIGVEGSEWAAAATVPTGCVWLLLGVQRGVLQGIGELGPVGISVVGEALGRLVWGLVLVAAGLGVTGAYLGAPVSMACAALALAAVLRGHAHRQRPPGQGLVVMRLRGVMASSWAALTGLTLIAVLQNLDTILVKQRIGGALAGSYAVASVAGKVVLWIAIGLGLYLLPEAARRGGRGVDARPALLRTLGLAGLVALPALLLFAAFPREVLSAAFGDDLAGASGALAWLAAAMTLLALTYLCVQHLLALGRHRFLWILAAAAAAEPVVVIAAGRSTTDIAVSLAILHAALAAAMGTLAFTARPAAQNRPS